MTSINIYDVDFDELVKIADINNLTIADIISDLMEYSEEMCKNLGYM